MKAVTLIFPVYGEVELLRIALMSLDRTKCRDFKVVIVDDDSPAKEKIRQVVEEVRRKTSYPMEYEKVQHVGNSTVLVNRAALVADTPYIAYMNSDIDFPDPKWLEATLACFERFDPVVGAVGIKQIFPQNGQVAHNGNRYNADGSWTHLEEMVPAANSQLKESGLCEGVTGCGLFTRKDIWEKAGGFEIFFSHGWDDAAYCLRLHELGYTVACQREHPIHHWRSKSYGRPQHPFYYENNRWIRLKYGEVIDRLISLRRE